MTLTPLTLTAAIERIDALMCMNFMITSKAEEAAVACWAREAAATLYAALDKDLWPVADALFDAHPWLMQYDDKGGWTGPVANENGWTP